ncbi:hypothetical protein ACBJ59_18765 [Nonomuraea sp. MTCD27]|uniref:hypothetical protein n=1 Tax=Nonomuraea sp. MTCD27 TaxID=1676747 RepID=UPI0035BEDCE3
MMPRHRTAAAFGLLGTALPAQAATGQVVVFSIEVQELTTWDNPTGSHIPPVSGSFSA